MVAMVSVIQSINQSNYWFNVQTFIREDDSDAQRMTLMHRIDRTSLSKDGKCTTIFNLMNYLIKNYSKMMHL